MDSNTLRHAQITITITVVVLVIVNESLFPCDRAAAYQIWQTDHRLLKAETLPPHLLPRENPETMALEIHEATEGNLKTEGHLELRYNFIHGDSIYRYACAVPFRTNDNQMDDRASDDGSDTHKPRDTHIAH